VKVINFVSCILFASAYMTALSQETVDISKITCDECLGYKITNPCNIASLVSDYFNAKRHNTIIDVQRLQADTLEVEHYCLVHSNAPVMQAFESVFGEHR
jgi:acid stress chaperone HdeB